MQKQNSRQADDVVEYQDLNGNPVRITVKDVVEVLCSPTKKGMVCSDEEARSFMRYCQGNRFNPWVKDCYLTGYDMAEGPPKFTPIASIHTFLKRAELSDQYDGMHSGVVVDPGWDCLACEAQGARSTHQGMELCQVCNGTGVRDEVIGDLIPAEQKLRGGWAVVKLKNVAIPVKKRILTERFNGGSQVWRQDPAGMSVKCAECDALRTAFPGALGNVYMAAESETHLQQGAARPAPTRSSPEFDTPTPTPPPASREAAPGEIAKPAPRQAPPADPPPKSNPGAKSGAPRQQELPTTKAPAPRKAAKPARAASQPAASEDDESFENAKPASKATARAEQEAQGDPADQQEDTPDRGAAVRKLRGLLLTDDVTEEQVIVFCMDKRWIDQVVESVDELPATWINKLLGMWPEVLPTLRAIEI